VKKAVPHEALISSIILQAAILYFLKPKTCQAGPLRQFVPGGTKTDPGSPSFWGPRRNLCSLFR